MEMAPLAKTGGGNTKMLELLLLLLLLLLAPKPMTLFCFCSKMFTVLKEKKSDALYHATFFNVVVNI